MYRCKPPISLYRVDARKPKKEVRKKLRLCHRSWHTVPSGILEMLCWIKFLKQELRGIPGVLAWFVHFFSGDNAVIVPHGEALEEGMFLTGLKGLITCLPANRGDRAL
jgi:hypothetical protein